jgi:hypothetical protein
MECELTISKSTMQIGQLKRQTVIGELTARLMRAGSTGLSAVSYLVG